MSALVHHALEVYVQAAKRGNPDSYIDPPQRRLEVNWSDLKRALKADLVTLAEANGIESSGTRAELMKRIINAEHIMVVGKIGGKGGMPV
jgi:hypothetical protein